MTPGEVIEEFRSQVSDENEPYLFSETEVLRWLIDAQDMFVRNIGGITDGSTNALIDIQLTADYPWSTFSPYILRIRSGRLLTLKKSIDFVHEADLAMYRTKDYGFVISDYLDDTDTGNPSVGILGITDGKIRWYKVPDADDTCRMHIYRLPYPRIVTEEDCFEIEEQHHIHLVMWMKHMAYGKEDAETYDKDLSESNERAFNAYTDKARKEKERQRFKPKQVRYGGIPF